MNWYSLTRAPDSAILWIGGDIGTFGHPATELIDRLDGASRVELFLDSHGGSVPDALAVHDALAAIDCTVTIRTASSAAVVIAQAGRVRRIYEGGSMMLHGPVDFVAGPSAMLRQRADELDGMVDRLAQILQHRTGQPASTVAEWLCGEDHWFTPEEALAAGLVDEVIAPPPRTAYQLAHAPGTASGPTEREALAIDLLNALGELPVRDRRQFGEHLRDWFAANVRQQ